MKLLILVLFGVAVHIGISAYRTSAEVTKTQNAIEQFWTPDRLSRRLTPEESVEIIALTEHLELLRQGTKPEPSRQRAIYKSMGVD